jgi:hypothetical protein
MVTVTPERDGLIKPETVTEPPITSLEEERLQDMVLGILDTVKDTDELEAPSCSESPSHEALTFHDPTMSGAKAHE